MRIISRLILVVLIFSLTLLTACNSEQETTTDNSNQIEDSAQAEKELGQVYEGDMVGEWAHGHGVLYEDGEILYEGDFVDGYIESYGKYYKDNLLRYAHEVFSTASSIPAPVSIRFLGI